MRRLGLAAVLAVSVGGCVSTDDQRLHDYNDDGIALYHRGAYDEARETFQAALKLKPADPNLLCNVGQCYDHLGQTDRAEETYRDCLRQAPGHADCLHALTALLVRENKRGDADQLVGDWIRREPRSAAAYAEFGWLCVQDKDYPRALSACQHAYELDPRDVHALNQLGRIYEVMNRKDRALAMYERSLEYQPHQPEVGTLVSRLKADGAREPHPD
ncbi:MAG TPA: tetratricopeptide repeat protein [Gemmataceae bacterium]|nr:tetratricopeptide repeat protein [Gemmataceae bacterium]